jgi:hypothetical protein
MADRPVNPHAVPSIHGNANVKSPVGDTLIVYADNAIWNATKNKFEKPEDVVRKK